MPTAHKQALQARYPALRTVLQEKLTTTGQILLLRMVRTEGKKEELE